MLALLKIMIVILIIVGLTLKTDVEVGISPEEQPDKPLKEINDIERQVEQFAHLRRVDALMVDEALGNLNVGMHKKHAKEIDGGVVARRRQILGAYYYHFLSKNKCYQLAKIMKSFICCDDIATKRNQMTEKSKKPNAYN